MTQDIQAKVPVKVDKYVQMYVALRDKIKLMDDEYKAGKKEFTDQMDQIEGVLQAALEKTGSEGIKTKFGSVYLSTKVTAALADPEAFMDFVIKNELFELLDRRASSVACRDYAEEHKAPPPGCNLNSFTSVNVRRPT
jgi:hypothetical protein